MFKIAFLQIALMYSFGMSANAFAQGVNPTEIEINALPPYCQAQYKGPPEARKMWAKRLGESSRGLNHHCHGMVYMSRALVEVNTQTRNRQLARAIDEFDYVLRGWSPNAPLYREAEMQRSLAESMKSR